MTTQQSTPTTASECPACTRELTLEDPLLGELVDCPECEAEIEVVDLDPIALQPAPEIQEDWGE